MAFSSDLPCFLPSIVPESCPCFVRQSGVPGLTCPPASINNVRGFEFHGSHNEPPAVRRNGPRGCAARDQGQRPSPCRHRRPSGWTKVSRCKLLTQADLTFRTEHESGGCGRRPHESHPAGLQYLNKFSLTSDDRQGSIGPETRVYSSGGAGLSARQGSLAIRIRVCTGRRPT
jgi:hypothetical protein